MRLAALLALLAAGFARAGTKWETSLADRWNVIHITNGFVEVGVVPALDGRIVNLRLRRESFNAVWALDNASSIERRLAYGLAIGGIVEPLAGATVRPHNATVDIDAMGMNLAVTAGGIRVSRRLYISNNATTVTMESTFTNQERHGVEGIGEWSAELAVGKDGLLLFAPGQRLLLPPAPTQPPTRLPVTGAWFAALDVASQTLLMVRNGAPVRELRIEAGDDGYVSVRMPAPAEPLPPGAKRVFTRKLTLCKGPTDLTAANGNAVVQVSPDHAVYAPGEPITVRVGAAVAVRGQPVSVRLSQGETTHRIELPCRYAGAVEWASWRLAGGLTASGEVGWNTLGQQGAVAIRVDPAIETLRQRQQAVERQVAELGERSNLAKRAEAAIARDRLARLQRTADSRAVEAWEKQLAGMEADLRRWLGEDR